MTNTGDGELGLDKTKVVVVEHDERWGQRFAELQQQLAVVLSPHASGVEIAHVGSTSVPGLAAKPVLDVAIGLAHDVSTETLIEAFDPIGLGYQGDLGDYGGRLFTIEPSAGVSVANVHVVAQCNFQWTCYLLFRDELRANEELRNSYGELKTSLAKNYENDRAGYNQAKFEFVFSTVSALAAEAGIDIVPSTSEPAE